MNDFIIWIVKGLFIACLASNITFERFKHLYVRFILAEAAISIICYVIGDVLGLSSLLPLLHTEQHGVSIFYLTPYYTLGWGNIPVMHRNCGMYLEPGMHQIFLNLGLYFLLSDNQKKTKKQKKKFIILVALLVITILTTRSTTGYLCLAAIILAFAMRNGFLSQKWRMQLLMIIMLGVLIIVELQTGVISSKLEGTRYGQGSGLTRYNDTFYGYYLATKSPLFGYGIFSTTMTALYAQYGIVNMSNGMASYCCLLGFPLVALLLFMMFKGINREIVLGWKSNLVFLVFILMCLNTEGVFLNLFMMIFFFKWKSDKKQNHTAYSSMINDMNMSSKAVR